MSVLSSPSVLFCLSVQSTLHTVPNSAWCFNSKLILFPQGSVCDVMVQCYCYLFSCTSVYQSQISMFALTLTYALIHNTGRHLFWFLISQAFLKHKQLKRKEKNSKIVSVFLVYATLLCESIRDCWNSFLEW